MKKLLLVGLLLSGMSVHAADGGGRPSGLVASKCRTCKNFKGPDFGIRNCQCGQSAADSAAVSAPDASRMPRVKTGGSVQERWNPEGQTTQAERDIREQQDRKLAEGLAGVQAPGSRDLDPATAQMIADILAEELEAAEDQRRAYDEEMARLLAGQERLQADRERQLLIDADAAYARSLAQEGAQQDTDYDAELARAMEMSLRQD